MTKTQSLTGDGDHEVTEKPNTETTAAPRKKARRAYMKSGTYKLKSAITEGANRGLHVIDRRTRWGQALAQWRTDLINDLGGTESVSTGQLTVIDLACKTRLLLDSVDAWLLRQPSLINQRRRCLYPVVRERQALADSLARYMDQLGLERRAKPVPSLSDYLASKTSGPREIEPQNVFERLSGDQKNAS